MSENLKKLREREKKIAEKSIDRHRRKVTLPYWHERYYPLAGMSQIEDLERKAGEARKEEEQVKEKLKRTEEEYKKVIEEVISTLSDLGKEEADSASKYQKLSNKYSTLPTVSRILSDFATEELRHSNKFFDLIHELRREISK